MKEIKQLGKHGEEASRNITELEALCMQHVEAAQKLREEMATLEGMVESRDELFMEIPDEIGLNRMGEDADEEEDDEEEDNDKNGGDAATPPAATPPPVPVPPTVVHEELVVEEEEDLVEMVPK
jgi:hypothetical protein